MTRHAAEQGAELVRRLLAFARQQELQPDQRRPRRAVRSRSTELLAHTLGGLVQLDWQLRRASGALFADQPQLELALMNLIINARDAMPEGGTIVIARREPSRSTATTRSALDAGRLCRARGRPTTAAASRPTISSR